MFHSLSFLQLVSLYLVIFENHCLFKIKFSLLKISIRPTIYWAQDRARQIVYIRVQVVGANDVKIDFEQSKLSFACSVDQQKYEFSMELNQEIIPEESKYRVMGQDVEILMKKKDGGKLGYVRIDWDKWQDEDDDEGEDSKLPEFEGMGGQAMPNLDQFKLPEHEDEHEEHECHDEHCTCHEHEKQQNEEEKDTQQENNEQKE